jgi:hypothetical protein
MFSAKSLRVSELLSTFADKRKNTKSSTGRKAESSPIGEDSL